RAWHPHVRAVHAQHLRHQRDPAPEAALTPSGPRRSLARDGKVVSRRAHRAPGGGRRRRRAHRRSPSESRPPALRRIPVAQLRQLPCAHGRGAACRARRRPHGAGRGTVKIGIAGLGLIGGSLALALRDRHEVTGYDNDERARAAAKTDGLRIAAGLEDLLPADAVVVATPISAIVPTLERLSQRSNGAVLL